MADLLEKALSEVAKLAPDEQDAVAAILLEELASKQRWTQSFAKSQNVLEKLAEEALAEHRAGLTKPLGRSALENNGEFRALYRSIPRPIQDKAKAAYQLWSENPDHPSLRFKKVHSRLPIYSVRVDLDWRAVGILEGNVVIWFPD